MRSVTVLRLAFLMQVVPAAVAFPIDRFVTMTGVDSGTCSSSATPCRSVEYAVLQTSSGDTVKVAGGVYDEHVDLLQSTSLAVSGGWSADFSVQDPIANTSRLRGEYNGHVFTHVFGVLAGTGDVIALALDSLTLSRAANGVDVTAGDNAQVSVSVTNSVLSQCRFGAINVDAGGTSVANVSIGSSTLRKNVAAASLPYGGGAVRVRTDTSGTVNMQVADSLFERNREPRGRAGAMGIIGYTGGTIDLDIQRCIFDRNGAGGDTGAALYVAAFIPEVTITMSLTDSVIRRSRHPSGWGGLEALRVTAAIENTAFIGNRSRNGAGALLQESTSTVTNSTFFGNRGGGYGGLTVWDGTLTLRNSILWDTGADAVFAVAGAVIDADHNDIESGGFNDLGGNISVDPLLDGDDLHLTSTSPAIDAGTCTGAPGTDIEGDSRPTGGGCDMGADEFVP